MATKMAAAFSSEARLGEIFLELNTELGKDVFINLQQFSAKSSGKNKTLAELSKKKAKPTHGNMMSKMTLP
jgi:hypothetical protein